MDEQEAALALRVSDYNSLRDELIEMIQPRAVYNSDQLAMANETIETMKWRAKHCLQILDTLQS